MFNKDLERNLTLCFHNSFCRNRETNVLKKGKRNRGVGGLPPTASEWPSTCCKTLNLKVRSQCCRRRRWSNDKEVNSEVNKEVNKEVTKKKMLKLRIVYVRKTQMRNQAIKLAIEPE